MARVKLELEGRVDGVDTYMITIYPENTNEVWSFEVEPVYMVDESALAGAVKSAEKAEAERRTW
jgi:hypothetical protein